MDYQRIYDQLIAKRQITPATGYAENHHVFPVCFGGSNERTNLVRLTGREHFIAHLLLRKLFPGSQMSYALWAMCLKAPKQGRTDVRNSRWYGIIREEVSRSRTGVKRGPMTEEQKAKISRGNCGKPKSEEHRAKLSIAATLRERKPHSEETKAKMRKPKTDEWKALASIRQKARREREAFLNK